MSAGIEVMQYVKSSVFDPEEPLGRFAVIDIAVESVNPVPVVQTVADPDEPDALKFNAGIISRGVVSPRRSNEVIFISPSKGVSKLPLFVIVVETDDGTFPCSGSTAGKFIVAGNIEISFRRFTGNVELLDALKLA